MKSPYSTIVSGISEISLLLGICSFPPFHATQFTNLPSLSNFLHLTQYCINKIGAFFTSMYDVILIGPLGKSLNALPSISLKDQQIAGLQLSERVPNSKTFSYVLAC